MRTLYIGNKNYSSWSLRPWLLMTQQGIAFEEVRLRLSWDPASPFKTTLRAIAPTGRVPVLVEDGFAVWDTMAIVEYIAERLPDQHIWPAASRARARARSLCAEMHAGFVALRNAFPMNIEASLSEVGPRCVREMPEVAADLERIEQMWRTQIEAHGGPFLFGDFCAADAYYAPVCARLRTYAPPMSDLSALYVSRVLELPAMRAWCEAASAENDFVAEDEPYRNAPDRSHTRAI